MAARGLIAGLLTAAIAVAFVAAPGAFAHGDDIEDRNPGYGMGYGMESDAMNEYCPGCGMTGGSEMGPGMMGGYGMGPGMMGGYGLGPGMMGIGPMSGLELNSEQQKQIARIETGLRKQNWTLQGEIIDARGELLQLYADETPDPKRIGAAYGKIFDLRRQMIEAAIEAHNRQRAVLTDEQRENLRRGRYGSGAGGYLHNYGRMDHQRRRHMTSE
ncbi:MAG TPA: periplasmic heavy metal sensor [Gammaproteobacteria bacterium]|nr:periplasmic heavy metal sensor [Gammaproteobacteria bacterium]